VKLTDKQAAFCREYAKDFNGSAAARRAGYNATTSDVQAFKLLSRPYVKVLRKLAFAHLAGFQDRVGSANLYWAQNVRLSPSFAKHQCACDRIDQGLI
jgi:Terminase small subunit